MALAATMIRCLVVATSHSALLCHCCVDSLVCRQRHGAHTRARARFSSIFRNFAKSPSIFPHSVQFYFLKCCLCIARNAETNVIKEAERKTERKKNAELYMQMSKYGEKSCCEMPLQFDQRRKNCCNKYKNLCNFQTFTWLSFANKVKNCITLNNFWLNKREWCRMSEAVNFLWQIGNKGNNTSERKKRENAREMKNCMLCWVRKRKKVRSGTNLRVV